MKKFLSLLLALTIVLSCFLTAYAKEPTVSSRSALVINLDNGQVLYSKGSNTQIDPSLLSQLMTMLLVLKDYDTIKDDDVTISYTVQNKMYEKRVELGALRLANLNAGETFTVSELFESLAVRSACDSAMALAEYIGGTESNFVADMNLMAKELGCKNTTFYSSHGIYDEKSNAKTTAEDIAIIYKALLEYMPYRDVMAKTSYICGEHTGQTMNNLILKSKTEQYISDCTGGHFAFHDKMSDTNNYGSSLVSTFSAKNGEFLVVVLGCAIDGDDNASFTKCFSDTRSLYTYASTNFEYKELIKEGKTLSDVKLRLAKGNKDYLKVESASGYKPFIDKSVDLKSFVLEQDTPAYVEAPITKGQKVGTLYVKQNGEVLATIDVVSSEDVEISRPLVMANKLKNLLSSPLFIVFILLIFLLVAAYIALAILGNKKGIIRKERTKKEIKETKDDDFIEL